MCAGWGALSGGWFEQAIAQAHGVHESTGHLFALIASIALAGLGILTAAFAYYDRFTNKVMLELRPAELSKRFSFLYRLSFNKFYIDELYEKIIIRPILAISSGLYRHFDMGVIDQAVDSTGLGTIHASKHTGRFDDRVVDGAVDLTGTAMLAGGNILRGLQTGRLANYFSVIMIGLIVILAFYFVF